MHVLQLEEDLERGLVCFIQLTRILQEYHRDILRNQGISITIMIEKYHLCQPLKTLSISLGLTMIEHLKSLLEILMLGKTKL